MTSRHHVSDPCATCGGRGVVGTLSATYACWECTPGLKAPVRTLGIATTPLCAALMSWAHGTDQEIRVGDVFRLHEDLEQLLQAVGIPEEHVQRVCGDAAPSWADGAVGGACDTDTKERRGHEFGDRTASQE